MAARTLMMRTVLGDLQQADQENLVKVHKHLNTDRCLSVRLIADELQLGQTMVHKLVTEDLKMRKLCAELVPKFLTDEQKARHLAVCEEMFQHLPDDPKF
jgi:hypothetical protein